eukprot:6199279-Pleurochrysis_carterae.AAC.1
MAAYDRDCAVENAHSRASGTGNERSVQSSLAFAIRVKLRAHRLDSRNRFMRRKAVAAAQQAISTKLLDNADYQRVRMFARCREKQQDKNGKRKAKNKCGKEVGAKIGTKTCIHTETKGGRAEGTEAVAKTAETEKISECEPCK